MYTLFLDRSSKFPSVACVKDDVPIFSYVWQGEPTRAPEWMSELEALLKKAQIPPDRIERFICGLGPGSFSGIRAGLAAVNGLALPSRTPVFGIASAAVVAWEHGSAETVTVVGDARRSRLWLVTYRVHAQTGRIVLLDGAAPTHTEADFQLIAADALPISVPAGSRIVTSEWERLQTVLVSHFGASGRLVQRSVFPSADALARMVSANSDRLRPEPSPIYLHPAV